MVALHSALVTLHIVVGALALCLFWVPVLARKGSPLHTRSGSAYAWAMTIVSLSGLFASLLVLVDPLGIRRPGQLIDPAAAAELVERFRASALFLLMLSILVFASVRHGIAALRERRHPGTLTQFWHKVLVLTLGVLGVLVGALGLVIGQLLLIIFGGVSLMVSRGMWREIREAERGEANLLVAHLGGMLGSGIGAYTAFFSFGGARFFSEWLPGQWQVVPWVLPTIIGTVVISRMTRRYRKSTAKMP